MTTPLSFEKWEKTYLPEDNGKYDKYDHHSIDFHLQSAYEAGQSSMQPLIEERDREIAELKKQRHTILEVNDKIEVENTEMEKQLTAARVEIEKLKDLVQKLYTALDDEWDLCYHGGDSLSSTDLGIKAKEALSQGGENV